MKRFILAFEDYYGEPNYNCSVYVNTDQIVFMKEAKYEDWHKQQYTTYIVYCPKMYSDGLTTFHISKEDYEELINEEREKQLSA